MKRKKRKILSIRTFFFVFRATRSERDARTFESRLKQYEIEMAELRARADAINIDSSRRIEENDVKKIHVFFCLNFVLFFF